MWSYWMKGPFCMMTSLLYFWYSMYISLMILVWNVECRTFTCNQINDLNTSSTIVLSIHLLNHYIPINVIMIYWSCTKELTAAFIGRFMVDIYSYYVFMILPNIFLPQNRTGLSVAVEICITSKLEIIYLNQ